MDYSFTESIGGVELERSEAKRLLTIPNVGLLGKLRSGKDQVAAYLTSNYGYTRFAFGDELKDDFHRTYPDIPREPKPRAGYQEYGQRMRKERGMPYGSTLASNGLRMSVITRNYLTLTWAQRNRRLSAQ